MSDSFLATKLAPPPLRTHLVARPRLTALLNEGSTRALTLISATAGFGKTTLVSEWLKERNDQPSPPPVIWLALDADDNTPTRLLRHVGAAVQPIAPAWGKEVSARLADTTFSGLEITPDALLNELNALQEPCIAILDDYHVITSPAVHTALGYALEHLPPQVHIVLITRADPPLPLARLRARDQLTEIRAADLAFTPEEAAQFLNRVMGLELTAEHVNALERRTEGWIAGLQLAALSLRGAGDIDAFIENFTGNDRYIFDYLAEEVIRKLDTPMRTFLLQTCILDRVCAALGNAVTGLHDSQALLERLERDNLFTIALDTHREWYRYHHLFGELLRHELRQTRADEISMLHRRAAEWYEQNGDAAEAIRHWLEAQEFERASELVEANVIRYLERAEFKTILNWLEALPQEYRERSPRLALVQVWAFLLTGEFEAAEAQLTRTAERLTDPADIAQLEALRALFVSLRGENRDRVGAARQAYERSANGSEFTRGLSAMNLGTSYLFEGELEAAFDVLGEAEQLMERAGNEALATIAKAGRADTEILRGQLGGAARRLEKILHAQEAMPTATNNIQLNSALVGLAELDREWNLLEEAQRKLARAAEQLNIAIGAPRFYLLSGAVQRALGQFNTAQEMLERARTDLQRFSLPILQNLWIAEQGALYLARGRPAAAVEWLAAHQVTPGMPSTFRHEPSLLVLAQTLIELKELDTAEAVLKRLAVSTETGGRMPRWIQTQVLHAVLDGRRGNSAGAQNVLQMALERAEPEGFVRLWVERGNEVGALLSLMTVSSLRIERYREKLIAAFPPMPSLPALSGSSDALSERELEILTLVAQGLSNGEIANRLTLTQGTVKWHVNNIFGKLDVHSRTQAVARARATHLLS